MKKRLKEHFEKHIGKWFVVGVIVILLVLFSLTSNREKTEVISSTKTEQITGSHSYSIFRTTELEKYFEFLENFDESKYEIVDISTSMCVSGYGSDEFYIVTYKTIE